MRKKALFLNDSNLCVATPDGGFIVLKSQEPILNEDCKEQLINKVPDFFEEYQFLGTDNMIVSSLWDLRLNGYNFQLNTDEDYQLHTKVIVGADNKSLTVTTQDNERFMLQTLFPVQDKDVMSFAITLARSFDEHFSDDKGYMTYKVFVDMSYIKWHTMLQFQGSDREEERKRIGNRIREIREAKDMKAKHLAKIAGIDASNWSRIEDGSYSVGLDTLHKIAKALGKRIDFVDNG